MPIYGESSALESIHPCIYKVNQIIFESDETFSEEERRSKLIKIKDKCIKVSDNALKQKWYRLRNLCESLIIQIDLALEENKPHFKIVQSE